MNAPGLPYARVDVAATDAGPTVMLDGKPAKTPARKSLVLPAAALASAVAAEWEAQADRVRPETMPLTRLAATAIDLTAERRQRMVGEAAAYAATDLVCHRAEAPADLVERQHEGWQPVLDWVAARWGARLDVTVGVVPVAQRAEALDALRAAVAGLDDLALVAVGALAGACGSLVIALAVADGRIDGDEAWRLSQIDARHQSARWGEDPEDALRRARLRDDIGAAAQILALARD